MNPTSMRTIERMLYPYKKGDRVRARLDIFCALRGCTVPIGTEGSIVDPKSTGCIGLLLVHWDSGPEFHCSGEGVELVPS